MKIICPWRSQMDMFILERCGICYPLHVGCGEMNLLISGTGRDGGTEWRHCNLSADRKIVSIHTATKSVYLMRYQFLQSFCVYVYCVTTIVCSERH